jgi:hypothetical protein
MAPTNAGGGGAGRFSLTAGKKQNHAGDTARAFALPTFHSLRSRPTAVRWIIITVPLATDISINLQAPRILYIGQTYRYSPEGAFYTFSQQIYYLFF